MGKCIKQLSFLIGKKMPVTAFGMTGCVRGLCCRNSQTYYYGIKGFFGIKYYKQWGYDY